MTYEVTKLCSPSSILNIIYRLFKPQTRHRHPQLRRKDNPESDSPASALSRTVVSLPSHQLQHILAHMAPEIISASGKPSRFLKPASLPNRAYVAFLAGNGDYVKGVVGLAKGLRKVKSAYPLVVAVLPDVPVEHRRELESQGCIVKIGRAHV